MQRYCYTKRIVHTKIERVCVLIAFGCASQINVLDGRGWTALHHACTHGQLASCEALLQRGINPDIQNNEGNTAMHYACLVENEAIVIALSKFGAQLNIKNMYVCVCVCVCACLHASVVMRFTC
jgi:ankyrin repeat protein